VGNWSSNGLIVSAMASSVKLASSRGYSFCNYRLLKGFISYQNLFDILLRLVVLKRPGFQSQKYGMLINFALSVSEYVTTNVTAKPDTFPREPNPCYTVVFYMCSCETIAVSKKQPFSQYTAQGKTSDRSSKQSFAVSETWKMLNIILLRLKLINK